MGKNRNRLAGTFLALLLLALPGAPSAAERRGVELTITLKDGHYLGGELIAVKPDSLLLLNLAGKDESVDLAGIRSIRITKKSKALRGGIGGLFAGWAVTMIYTSTQKGDFNKLGAAMGGCCCLCPSDWGQDS